MHSSTVISYIFAKIVAFFLSKPVIEHSPAASIRCDLETPASIFLAPSISSPCPNANGEIDLLVTGSSD